MSDSVKEQFLAVPELHAVRTYESIKGDLLLLERQYQRLNLSAVFGSMARAHEDLGLLAYFTRGDMAAFKQHWHLASRLRCHAARHISPCDDYTTGGYMKTEFQLMYSLLSESPVATNEAATLETYHLLKYRDNPRAREYSFHIAQLGCVDNQASQIRAAAMEMNASKRTSSLS